MTPLAPTPLGTRLALRIQPRASRNAIVGLHGQSIRIRLAAPPVDGAANKALVSFLVERLGVSAAAVELVRGHGGRDKVVEVTGLAPEEVARRLGL
ncbi:MAG TPA: DUF167 domain-containing protein [Gemmatimonadales bacterium]|jgi:uncharacterized protein (TIGR00251 family)